MVPMTMAVMAMATVVAMAIDCKVVLMVMMAQEYCWR